MQVRTMSQGEMEAREHAAAMDLRMAQVAAVAVGREVLRLAREVDAGRLPAWWARAVMMACHNVGREEALVLTGGRPPPSPGAGADPTYQVDWLSMYARHVMGIPTEKLQSTSASKLASMATEHMTKLGEELGGGPVVLTHGRDGAVLKTLEEVSKQLRSVTHEGPKVKDHLFVPGDAAHGWERQCAVKVPTRALLDEGGPVVGTCCGYAPEDHPTVSG